MSKKIFNPSEWLDKDSQTPANVQPRLHASIAPDLASQIEIITQRVESSAIDIAPNYADWRDLGFALADALGEDGRTYYQRLSRFYPGYTPAETNKQFNKCLTAHGHGITAKTLFHLVKQAGIDVATPSIPENNQGKQSNPKSPISPISPMEDLEEMEDMPTFSPNIQPSLPGLLAQIVSHAISPEDADLLLLGSITVLSACLPNVYGIYHSREVYSNLFLFVTAQASAGKGRLTLCRHLVQPIHDNLKQRYATEME